jgi:hypothetical protein
MSSDFQQMADLMGQPGVTIRQFCGLDIQDGLTCPNEAVGEILAELEDGVTVPIPICEGHLHAVQAQYSVEELDT